MSYDFAYDGYEDPGPNVLTNGLPLLPAEIEDGHGVAVARWLDGGFGVVMVVYRDDHYRADDHYKDGGEYQFEVQPYLRIAGQWDSTDASGGSGWYSPPF